MTEFLAHCDDAILVTSHMCRFGMTTAGPGGASMPVLKPTRWLTNSSKVANALNVKCLGKHEHGLLKGGNRAHMAQIYPPRLCRVIAQAFAKELEGEDGYALELGQDTSLPKPPATTTDHRAFVDDDKVHSPPTHHQACRKGPPRSHRPSLCQAECSDDTEWGDGGDYGVTCSGCISDSSSLNRELNDLELYRDDPEDLGYPLYGCRESISYGPSDSLDLNRLECSDTDPNN